MIWVFVLNINITCFFLSCLSFLAIPNWSHTVIKERFGFSEVPDIELIFGCLSSISYPKVKPLLMAPCICVDPHE